MNLKQSADIVRRARRAFERAHGYAPRPGDFAHERWTSGWIHGWIAGQRATRRATSAGEQR